MVKRPGLELLTDAVEITTESPMLHEVLLAELNEDFKRANDSAYNKPGLLMVPAVASVIKARSRCRDSLDTTIVSLAAERYRLALGTWPEAATDLNAFLPGRVPDDLFVEEPLRLSCHWMMG